VVRNLTLTTAALWSSACLSGNGQDDLRPIRRNHGGKTKRIDDIGVGIDGADPAVFRQKANQIIELFRETIAITQAIPPNFQCDGITYTPQKLKELLSI
jgi:hypothetical protein